MDGGSFHYSNTMFTSSRSSSKSIGGSLKHCWVACAVRVVNISRLQWIAVMFENSVLYAPYATLTCSTAIVHVQYSIL